MWTPALSGPDDHGRHHRRLRQLRQSADRLTKSFVVPGIPARRAWKISALFADVPTLLMTPTYSINRAGLCRCDPEEVSINCLLPAACRRKIARVDANFRGFGNSTRKNLAVFARVIDSRTLYLFRRRTLMSGHRHELNARHFYLVDDYSKAGPLSRPPRYVNQASGQWRAYIVVLQGGGCWDSCFSPVVAFEITRRSSRFHWSSRVLSTSEPSRPMTDTCDHPVCLSRRTRRKEPSGSTTTAFTPGESN